MRIVRAAALAAILLGVIGSVRHAVAGTAPPTASNSAIFVANSFNVTAYPIASSGDVAPIALMTDMAGPSGLARDTSGRTYVANRGTNTITVYAANANGNVPPLAVIGGSNTGLDQPSAIALDATGKIYVLNTAANFPGINVYPPLANSTGILNEAPIASIAGSQTLLDEPDAIALDSHGNIYVANLFGGHAEFFDSGRLTVYAAGSNGNVAPATTISGDKTGLGLPVGIAVDSSGNIYSANAVNADIGGKLKRFTSITVYSAGSKGNAPPIATIAGNNANLSPGGIAVDSSRNIYVTGAFSIEMFAAGSNGNVPPALTITGPNPPSSFPGAIALDSGRDIYVLNYGLTGVDSVTVYPAGSSGDAVPIATITSNFTGINGAYGVALDSVGNIYVINANVQSGGSVAIYPAGSDATGSPPVSTITGNNTGLEEPSGIALDSSDNIFVLNYLAGITMYPAGSSGNIPPAATINVDGTGKTFPTAIAVGPGDDLYVTSVPNIKCRGRRGRSCRPVGVASVAAYPAGSNGFVNPSAIIRGSHTKLGTPLAVAVDHNGKIYVGNEGPTKCTSNFCRPTGPSSVYVYAAGSNGDVKPIATISGAATGLVAPFGITLDSNGNIYVLNVNALGYGCPAACDQNSILVFAAGSDGNVAPMATIAGPSAGLTLPRGIAIGPVGP
jgi:hemin uptake protein HemP